MHPFKKKKMEMEKEKNIFLYLKKIYTLQVKSYRYLYNIPFLSRYVLLQKEIVHENRGFG